MNVGKERLKGLVVVFMCAMIFGAYALNAIGEINHNFHFEPPMSLILLFVFLVGGGLFDLSVQSIAVFKHLLSGELLSEIKTIEETKTEGTEGKQ